MMRVTETAHWLEWQEWADPILQRGVGLEWDEGAVEADLP